MDFDTEILIQHVLRQHRNNKNTNVALRNKKENKQQQAVTH